MLPFVTYALDGFLEGLKEQLAYVRKLQMELAWLNYVHDVFRHENTKAARPQKSLLLDIFRERAANFDIRDRTTVDAACQGVRGDACSNTGQRR